MFLAAGILPYAVTIFAGALLSVFVSALLSAMMAALGMLSWGNHADIISQIVVFSAALFVCCMVCHGELTRLKPHPGYLTGYYLMIALGGALGSVFVALIAPLIFFDYLELHVDLLGAGALCFIALYADRGSWFRRKRVSWGATPVHLLTTEAFETYLRHLNPDGVIALLIDTWNLNFEPVIRRLAAHLDLKSIRIDSPPGPNQDWGTVWMPFARDGEFLTSPPLAAAATEYRASYDHVRLWTDDYTSLLPLLEFD